MTDLPQKPAVPERPKHRDVVVWWTFTHDNDMLIQHRATYYTSATYEDVHGEPRPARSAWRELDREWYIETRYVSLTRDPDPWRGEGRTGKLTFADTQAGSALATFANAIAELGRRNHEIIDHHNRERQRRARILATLETAKEPPP